MAVPAPRLPSCAATLRARHERSGLPVSNPAGSTVALARFDDRTMAYVADEDARALRVVDLDKRQEVASAPLHARPAQIAVMKDGRVLATASESSAVVVLEPAGSEPEDGLRALCQTETPTEPVGLTLTADQRMVLVASRWGQSLSGYDTATMEQRFTTRLPRDPHSVVMGEDGLAYVSHVVGGLLSIVDPQEPQRVRVVALNDERRIGGQGFAIAAAGDRVLLPMVLTDPGNTSNDVVLSGYGSGEERSRVMSAAIARAPSAANEEMELLAGGFRALDCLLPRAALWYPRAEKLLLACMGNDAVGYQHFTDGVFHHFLLQVAAGPTGMAIDRETRLVVWSQFAAALTVVELALDSRQLEATHPVTIRLEPRGAPSELAALGRKLFHAAGDKRLAFDGRACASCHPSGRDDGLTWATFEGPRQTPMLLGRLSGTAPYDWNGKKPDLHAHLRRTLRRLAGTGLTAQERRALLAYVSTLAPPRVDRDAGALATLGAQIFADTSTGCADCHTGRMLTDGLSHDVESVIDGDKLHEFDTPSLRFVAQSAPYFHDGRYPTLLAMLSDEQLHMGSTAHLSEAEREALVAYLHAL